MNNIVCLFVIGLGGISSSLNIEKISRIQGGLPADDNQFPYMISLQELSQINHYRRGHRCGGALFTPRSVVTTASCLYNSANGVPTLIAPNEYRVFGGAVDITNDTSLDRHRTIRSITVHPDYNPEDPHVNDIAVIILTSEFPSNVVSVVAIALNDPPTAQQPICTSSGWGSQNQTNNISTQLMYLETTKIRRDVCQTYFTSTSGENIYIQDTMVCALATTNSSSCMGDSGNPLVCNNVLHGILTRNSHDCSNSVVLRPEIYTQIYKFASWMHTAGASTFQPGTAVLAGIAIVQIITNIFFN